MASSSLTSFHTRQSSACQAMSNTLTASYRYLGISADEGVIAILSLEVLAPISEGFRSFALVEVFSFSLSSDGARDCCLGLDGTTLVFRSGSLMRRMSVHSCGITLGGFTNEDVVAAAI